MSITKNIFQIPKEFCKFYQLPVRLPTSLNRSPCFIPPVSGFVVLSELFPLRLPFTNKKPWISPSDIATGLQPYDCKKL